MNSPLTTTQELNTARDYYRNERIPASALQLMDAATDALVHQAAAEDALQLGQRVSDFTLPDAQGLPVSLSGLLEDGPVVIVFYRGGWCPYCNIHLRGFQRVLPELRAAGAQLVGISPQLPDQSLSTQEKNALSFPVLSDEGLAVAQSFGVAFELPENLVSLYAEFGHALVDSNGEHGARSLPMPATFVIGQDGRVIFRHVEEDYTQRADPETVLLALRSAGQFKTA
jgi:peroxiredoxin